MKAKTNILWSLIIGAVLMGMYLILLISALNHDGVITINFGNEIQWRIFASGFLFLFLLVNLLKYTFDYLQEKE